MTFENDKKNCLSKVDKSNIGSIDDQIVDLCNGINKISNYYTTSSCSGRILILTRSEKKNDTNWLFVSHEKVGFSDIENILKKLPSLDVWFRLEGPILHVAAKSLEDAAKILELSRSCGFKRGGIISTKKIVLELQSTEYIEALIAKKGCLLVDKNYLSQSIVQANIKLENGWKKINNLSNKIKKS